MTLYARSKQSRNVNIRNSPRVPLYGNHKTFLQAQPLCVVVNVVTSERFAVRNGYNDAKRLGL